MLTLLKAITVIGGLGPQKGFATATTNWHQIKKPPPCQRGARRTISRN